MSNRPTLRQIKCVHNFVWHPSLPLDKYICANGCGGIQTQFPSCNGNCRCGGEE